MELFDRPPPPRGWNCGMQRCGCESKPTDSCGGPCVSGGPPLLPFPRFLGCRAPTSRAPPHASLLAALCRQPTNPLSHGSVPLDGLSTTYPGRHRGSSLPQGSFRTPGLQTGIQATGIKKILATSKKMLMRMCWLPPSRLRRGPSAQA